MEALRLLLEAKNQAWMVAVSALEVAQQEEDAWATRRRRPQHWAAGFAAALPLEEWRGHRRRPGSRHGHPRRAFEFGYIGSADFDGIGAAAGSFGVRPLPCRPSFARAVPREASQTPPAS